MVGSGYPGIVGRLSRDRDPLRKFTLKFFPQDFKIGIKRITYFLNAKSLKNWNIVQGQGKVAQFYPQHFHRESSIRFICVKKKEYRGQQQKIEFLNSSHYIVIDCNYNN